MEKCVFKQIFTQENKPVRLYLTLLQNSIEIILFQNETAWKSTVIKKDLNQFAVQYKLDLENYCDRLLQYIRDANPEIIFSFNDEELIINRLLDNSLKVKFFTCKFEKVNYVQHVEQIMDKFYSEKIEILEKLDTVTKEKDEIEKYKTYCELKLKDLVRKKTKDEDEQLGRFVLILNEKKRRIQHLTELLEAFKQGRPTVNPVIKVKGQKRKSENKDSLPERKKETISDSESTDNEDTSEGENASKNSIKEESLLPEDSKPSTSTQFDFLEDDVPQIHALPKRLKQETSTDVIVLVPPSESKPEPKIKDEGKPKRNKSPTIDLNTQQLLDIL